MLKQSKREAEIRTGSREGTQKPCLGSCGWDQEGECPRGAGSEGCGVSRKGAAVRVAERPKEAVSLPVHGRAGLVPGCGEGWSGADFWVPGLCAAWCRRRGVPEPRLAGARLAVLSWSL